MDRELSYSCLFFFVFVIYGWGVNLKLWPSSQAMQRGNADRTKSFYKSDYTFKQNSALEKKPLLCMQNMLDLLKHNVKQVDKSGQEVSFLVWFLVLQSKIIKLCFGSSQFNGQIIKSCNPLVIGQFNGLRLQTLLPLMSFKRLVLQCEIMQSCPLLKDKFCIKQSCLLLRDQFCN